MDLYWKLTYEKFALEINDLGEDSRIGEDLYWKLTAWFVEHC